MSNQKHSIFSQKPPETISSPNKLNQLMQVVKPKTWLPLFTLGSVVGVTLTWGIFGSIPITIEGRGVIIYPSDVVPLQSQSAGQLMALNVKVGDVVQKGQILARVDQTELRKQLQQQQNKLKQLELQRQKLAQKKNVIHQQSQYLQQRMEELQLLSPLLKIQGSTTVSQQRQNLQQRLQQTQALSPVFQRRMEIRKQLFQKEGAISSDEALKAEQEYLQNLERISDFKSQLQELSVAETQQARNYRDNLTTMSGLQSQLQRLVSEQVAIAQQEIENENIRSQQIQDIQREIIRLELQLGTNSQIVSQHSGRIVEVMATPGQAVTPGTRLAAIAVENSQSKLVGVTYFPVEEGKKIQPGMPVQITPENVKEQNLGGILGTVTNISDLPITKAIAANRIGNPEILKGLEGQQQELIQVVSELNLDPNTSSGYKWSSSQGANLQLASGTTTIVKAKVEDRAPISFILPMFKSEPK